MQQANPILQTHCFPRSIFHVFRKHVKGMRVIQSHVEPVDQTITRTCAVVSVSAASVDARPPTIPSGQATAPEVLLTREKGKNGKLQQQLEKRGIICLEMPLIETVPGPDREVLAEVLCSQTFDWICITSPEAANIFLDAWHAAGRPAGLRIAAVGEGTGMVLTQMEGPALRPQFVPSAGNAVHFSAELPHIPGGNDRVLYPTSSRAGSDLQSGLAVRGFTVTRFNTYDTVPVAAIEPETLEQARRALVVTAASPSTIKSWVKFFGNQSVTNVAVACIGSTSAKAAERLGLGRIYYPVLPGMEGFVTSIEQALADAKQSQR